MPLDQPVEAIASPLSAVAKAIADCGLGVGLNPARLEQLAAELNPLRKTFLDREILCRSGEAARCFWLLCSGTLDICEEAEGQSRTVIHRRAPAIVGEIGLGRPQLHRTATMVASGHVAVYEIPYARVEGIVPDDLRADFWRSLFVSASDKLAESVPQRAELSAGYAGQEALLRKFVNPYALAVSRTAVRGDYQRVEALVWFSDLVGFSVLAHAADPDRVASLVREAGTRISDAIESEGGYVDKFMGDGVMAWWILEGRNETDRRAIADAAFRAAERARLSIGGMTPPGGLAGSLQVRIGLDWCPAHAGDFGSARRSAFTLIGDGVNAAARLEQARQTLDGQPLGSIRVGDSLHPLLSELHRARLPRRVQVRVKDQDYTVHTYEKD